MIGRFLAALAFLALAFPASAQTLVSGGCTIGCTFTTTTLSGVTTLPGSGNSIDASGNISATSFIPTGSAVPTNGLYLPSANTPSIASNSSFIASFALVSGSPLVSIGSSSASQFPEIDINATSRRLSLSLGGGNVDTIGTVNDSLVVQGAIGLTLGTSASGSTIIQSGAAATGITLDTSQHVILASTTTGTNADVLCLTAGGQIVIQAAASCTISSLRFKPDWQPLRDSAMTRIMALAPGSFHLDTGPNPDRNAESLRLGLNAENVAAVEPRAAIYEQDMTTPKAYHDEAIIALLVKGMQEQQAQIDVLNSCHLRVMGSCWLSQ